jgi:hypothetical protein
MKQVQIVSPNQIYQVWDIVKPLLETAFVNFENSDYDIEHVKVSLVREGQLLFVVVEDNSIIGAFTVEVINYPNHRVAHTISMGGKGIFDKDTVAQYEEWARANGITKIRAFAKDPQARLFRIKLGLNKITNVVEKTL